MSPTSSSPRKMRIAPVSVTSPIAVPWTSHFAQTASTSSSARGLADAEHPLLRLGDHDLERLHVGLAQRHARDVEVDARRRPWTPSPTRDDVRPGGAEVLQRDEQPALEQLERALHELLLRERVADLDRRALVARRRRRARRRPAPTRRRCRRARSRRRRGRARCRRRPPRERIMRRVSAEAERHRVDEAVLLVGRLEVDLAADRRHADRVAVVADAGDRAVEQVARALARSRARRSAASRAPRSAARRSRRCRAGSRRRRWPRPGTARPRSGGCATRP